MKGFSVGIIASPNKIPITSEEFTSPLVWGMLHSLSESNKGKVLNANFFSKGVLRDYERRKPQKTLPDILVSHLCSPFLYFYRGKKKTKTIRFLLSSLLIFFLSI